MRQAERCTRILAELQQKSAVSISDLSDSLQVSAATIRKDLQTLEAQKLLTRVLGGAIPCKTRTGSEPEVQEPPVKNLALKKAVAREAAKLIRSGDSLLVMAGKTPHLTVQYAEDCTNLKIVTDSLLVAEDLCHRLGYQVIILGGEIYTENWFVHGRDTVRQAGRYMADKAIVTVDGIDVDAGLTTLRVEGADTMKSILARARMRIVVADLTKIGVESFCHISDISIMDILVTNCTDDPEKLKVLQKIAEAGVRVVLAKPLPETEGEAQFAASERGN